ncbi:MAG: methyltransferase, TIGR04325 family [Bacteroidetes bacterium]|nr:methyltransferase, TIGR04325 family [Bacteroidota bacterium]
MSKIIKQFVPPILTNLYKKATSKYGWFGNYTSWQEAQNDSTGYDSLTIVEKVKEALLKVKNGEAVYERDSVLFDKIEYSWPVLATLMWIANQDNGKLNVLDFGGSLGSTYFQNQKFLSDLMDVKWNIVEQDKFVEYGKKYFEDDKLKFYENIDLCLNENRINVILLSCVLPYVENPYELLEMILQYKFEFILFDRMPFFEDNTPSRITIHKVDPTVYPATIPTHIFNESSFTKFMKREYDLISDFESELKIQLADGTKISNKGFIYKYSKHSKL